jgi:16S rRNA (adenine1518-N6/adenine1519-N6)-dimethyltransferase
MIYSNSGELIELLKREKLWAQKKLGQNFLVNPAVLEQIVKAADLKPSDSVLEIGPGLGILTEQLAKRANNVTAVELDRSIIPVLQKNLGNAMNVEIVHADALKTALPSHPYKVVANIPYYITSPLLNHFLQPRKPEELRPSLLVLLVQKEVAQKICARDGDHSVLSLQVHVFGKPSMVYSVGKGSFFPQPKVDSAVIRIETYPEPRVSDVGLFFRMIKGAFSQKRKKLSNTLPNALNLKPADAAEFFRMSGVSPDARPQNISLDGWNALIQAYGNLHGKN